jgi:uncharacterized protein
MELKGKIAVVTGGNDGLGFSISKRLLGAGCVVHAISRSNNPSSELKKHDSFHSHKADVSNFNQIKETINNIGKIDILINNAGVWLEGVLEENQPDKISETVDINLKGMIYTSKVAIPTLKKNNKGYIINISSTSGLKGKAEQSVYCATKFAVQGFTESLKEELKPFKIKVAGFYPGGMNTGFFDKAGKHKENKNWMDTDKVANTILFMLQNDDNMTIDHVVINRF